MWPFSRRPTIDPALGDPGAARLRVDLAAHDWRAVSALFAATVDHDDRSFYYRQAGAVDGVQEWIPEWVAAEPTSVVPVLVAAQRYVSWAWEARAAIGGDPLNLFHQRLRVAEDLLRMAVDLDDDDPAPWAFMVNTARGLQLGQDEARRRFGEAVIRHRWHITAHEELCQQLTPRWGGSSAALRDLTRRTVTGMPDGCPLGVLVAYEHLEEWLELHRQDTSYLRQPAVVAELHGAADRSVRHPAYRRRPGWPQVHNMFAWAFSAAGETAAAAEQFDAVGDLVTAWPWEYGQDLVTAFVAARRTAHRQ